MPLNTNINVGEHKVPTNSGTNSKEQEEELDAPYLDERKITISLVHNYSMFRKVNMKVMGQRKDIIGSSVRSSQILSSNKGEVDAYFPALIGLSPSHPDFTSRVKNYLNNIHFVVNENDVDLNISFLYNHKRDYLRIKKAEDEINDAYDKIDRSSLSKIKQAIADKVAALNSLESTKYKYGSPQNLEQYLIYRHCILYRDVAKDTAVINSDPNVRFYIKDKNREKLREKKLLDIRKKALVNFSKLCGTEAQFNAVFVEMSVSRNDNLAEALLKDREEKEAILIDFANNEPERFNKFYNDKYVTVRAMIETLITRGELVRSDYNQQISTADGTFIGANMNEAVAWFENPTNATLRAAYEKKIKLF